VPQHLRGACLFRPRSTARCRLGSLADISGLPTHVRFTLKSGHVLCTSACPLCAISGDRALDARFKEWGCRAPRKLLSLHDLSPTPSKHLTQCLPAFRHPRAQVKLCVGSQSLPKAGRACGIRARGGAGQVCVPSPHSQWDG
jgi:hypothetical protein